MLVKGYSAEGLLSFYKEIVDDASSINLLMKGVSAWVLKLFS